MSDDEADPELLALLRQSLGLGPANQSDAPADTKVLEGARYICDNSIDVALDSQGTRKAADSIWASMRHKEYSTKTWSTHELHPKAKNEDTINLIFTIDLLNFSFWSESGPDQRYAVRYKGKNWTGYWSLVAALQRALDEGTPHNSHS
jgi:Potential Queuosine, Q, salvage protein family